MRAFFSAFFLLGYFLFALFAVVLALNNTDHVAIETIFWGPVEIATYLLIAISFASGLFLGLGHSALLSLKHLFRR